ncbi:MAG: hypothetical protein WC415_04655 [Patescibacteria group bacterium]
MQILKNIINLIKKPNYILIAAWLIPAAVLLTILYLNFLPFGYEKTLTINVGSKNDDKGEFRLEQTPALGSRQELDGETFRYLDGLTYAVYEPKVVLNNATIEAELTASSGVSFILPPDLTDVKWDYDWNADNIGDYFDVETSEENIYKLFKQTDYKDIISFMNFSPVLDNPLYQEGCPEGGVCSSSTTKGFAIEVFWQSTRYNQLLRGDITLYQTQKELVMKYKDITLKYPLPDYFMGETRTAIIGYDGKDIYLVTDKGGANTALKSPVVMSSDKKLYINKDKDTTAIRLHESVPSLIDTKDGAIHMDGSTRLVMPNTADQFEDGPFTVYAEWTPEKAENGQQIIGHYNWEIWQNEKSVSFSVGRMSTSTGPFYKITYSIDETFFNQKHTFLAVYSPISTSTPVTNGYIEFFVDGIFAGREYFANETIWKDYNGRNNLSIGETIHNNSTNPYLEGNIYQAKLTATTLKPKSSINLIFSPDTEITKLSIYGTGELTKFKIEVKK